MNGNGPLFLPPREDINSPDMYIPVMAFVTYILLSTLLAGLRGAFRPELLGLTATNAFAVVVIELLLLKLGTYLLNISNESQWLDLVAYSGYKFVGVIATVAVAGVFTGGKGTGGWVGWTVFGYTFMANAFFLVRRGHSRIESCGVLICFAAEIAQVCSAAGDGDVGPADADHRPLAEESPHTVFVRLLVRRAARLYVVVDEPGIVARGQSHCVSVMGEIADSLDEHIIIFITQVTGSSQIQREYYIRKIMVITRQLNTID